MQINNEKQAEYLEYANTKLSEAIMNGLNDKSLDLLLKIAKSGFTLYECRGKALEITDFLKTELNKRVGGVWKQEKNAAKNGITLSQLHSIKEIRQYYEIVKLEAQNMVFESYLLYMEKNRPPKERFYAPKQKQFQKIGVVNALQNLLDDKTDVLCISMPPGTGKTTLEKFFHSGVMGWFPDEYNLFFSHSSDITRMYYDGVLAMVTNDQDYTWHEIFPHLAVTSTNAKMMQINIGKYKPFMNLQTCSVGSDMSGKVRASAYLFVDDLIGNIEEALNKTRLDKLWNVYTVDARQRKVENNNGICKELIIATRWSVNDVIGRLHRIYANNPRYEFIAIPDIDDVTGQSNFDFDFNGFSVDFFRSQQALMDDISYKCLYKNQPIEREGLLYHEDELRRYLELPMDEPDAIIGVCDTKSKGTDFLVLPVMYQYGGDFYMTDCICTDSSDYGVQYGRMANMIVDNNMQQCEFESNAGGDRVAFEVDKLVKEKGGRCNITTKPTETNKETRIIVNADWVKKHVLFKDVSMYKPKTEYAIFIDWLLCYSVTGKNTHDDVPDALANFALFVTKLNNKPKPTNIIKGGMI
jgi:predicted phage terminase large subunit-like protein